MDVPESIMYRYQQCTDKYKTKTKSARVIGTTNVRVLETTRGSYLSRSTSLTNLPETFIHSSQRRPHSLTRLESARRKSVCVYESDYEIDYESDYSYEKYVLWNQSDRSKQNLARHKSGEKLQIREERINESNDEFTASSLETETKQTFNNIKSSYTNDTSILSYSLNKTRSENSNFVCVYDTDHEINEPELRQAKQRQSMPKKSQEHKLSEQRSQLEMEISIMRKSRSRLETGTSHLNESRMKTFSDYGCYGVKEVHCNERKKGRPSDKVHGYSSSGDSKRTYDVNHHGSSKTRGRCMSRKFKSGYESDYKSEFENLDERYTYQKGNSNSSRQLEQNVPSLQARPTSRSQVGIVSELEVSDCDLEVVAVNCDMEFDGNVSSMCELCGVLFKSGEELEDHVLLHFESMKELNTFLNKRRSNCVHDYQGRRSILRNRDQRSSSSGEKKKVKFEIGFDQDLNQPPDVTNCEIIDLNICDKFVEVPVSDMTDIPGCHTTAKLKNRPLVKSGHFKDNLYEDDCCPSVSVSDMGETKIIKCVDGKMVYFTHNIDLVESCLKNDVKVCLTHVDNQNEKSKNITKTDDSSRSEEKHTEEQPIAECSDNGHDLECVCDTENVIVSDAKNTMKVKLSRAHKNKKVSNDKSRCKTINTELIQRQRQLLIEKRKRTENCSDKKLKNRTEKVNEINNIATIDSACCHCRNLIDDNLSTELIIDLKKNELNKSVNSMFEFGRKNDKGTHSKSVERTERKSILSLNDIKEDLIGWSKECEQMRMLTTDLTNSELFKEKERRSDMKKGKSDGMGTSIPSKKRITKIKASQTGSESVIIDNSGPHLNTVDATVLQSETPSVIEKQSNSNNVDNQVLTTKSVGTSNCSVNDSSGSINSDHLDIPVNTSALGNKVGLYLMNECDSNMSETDDKQVNHTLIVNENRENVEKVSKRMKMKCDSNIYNQDVDNKLGNDKRKTRKYFKNKDSSSKAKHKNLQKLKYHKHENTSDLELTTDLVVTNDIPSSCVNIEMPRKLDTSSGLLNTSPCTKLKKCEKMITESEPEKTILNNVSNQKRKTMHHKAYCICEDRSHDKAGHGIKLKGLCSTDKKTRKLKTKKEHDNIRATSLASNSNLDITRTCRRGKKRPLSKEFVSSSCESDYETNSRKSGAITNIRMNSSATTNTIGRYVDSSTSRKVNERYSDYKRNDCKTQAKCSHIRLRKKLRKYNERREDVQNSLRKISECVISKEAYFQKRNMKISTRHKTEPAVTDSLAINKEAVAITQERSIVEVTVDAIAHADQLESDFIKERSSVVTDKDVYFAKESMTKSTGQLNVDFIQSSIAESNVKLNVKTEYFDSMPERNMTESTAVLNVDVDYEAVDTTHEQNNVESTVELNTGVNKDTIDIIHEKNMAEAIVDNIAIFDTTQEYSMTVSTVELNVDVDKQVFDTIQERKMTESNVHVDASVDAHNGAYDTTQELAMAESNVKLNVDGDKETFDYIEESSWTDSTVELNVNIEAFDTTPKIDVAKSTADIIVNLDKDACDTTQETIMSESNVESNMNVNEELSDTAVECSMTESTAELNEDVEKETVDSTQKISMADTNVELNAGVDKEVTVQKLIMSESTDELYMDKEPFDTLQESKLTKSTIEMNVDIEVLTTILKSNLTESNAKSNVDVDNEVLDTTGERNLIESTEELNTVVDEETYYTSLETNMTHSNVELTVDVYKNTVDTIQERIMTKSTVNASIDADDEAFDRTQELNIGELDVELNVYADKEVNEGTHEMNMAELDVHVDTDNEAFHRKQKMNTAELYVVLNVDADNKTIGRPHESSIIATTCDSILDAEKEDADITLKQNLSELTQELADTEVDEEILEGLEADIDILLSSPDHEVLIFDEHVVYNDLEELGSKSFSSGNEFLFLNKEETDTKKSKNPQDLKYSVVDSKSSLGHKESKFDECDNKEKCCRTEIELLENSDAIYICLALGESQTAGSKRKENRICKAANDKLKNTLSQMNFEIDENQNKLSVESKQRAFTCGNPLNSALNFDEKVKMQGDTDSETQSLAHYNVSKSDSDKEIYGMYSPLKCNKTEKCLKNEMKSQSKEGAFVCNKESSSVPCSSETAKKKIVRNEHIHEEVNSKEKHKNMHYTEKEVQSNDTEIIDLTESEYTIDYMPVIDTVPDTGNGDAGPISFSPCISLLVTTEENTALDKTSLNRFYRCDKCNKVVHTVGGLHLSACTSCDENIVHDNLEQTEESWKVNLHDKPEGIDGKNIFSEQVEPEHIDTRLNLERDMPDSEKSNMCSQNMGNACKVKKSKHKSKKRKGTLMPAIERKGVKLLLRKINLSSFNSPLYNCKFVDSPEKPCWTVKDSVTDGKYPSTNRKHFNKFSTVGNDKNQTGLKQYEVNQCEVNQYEDNQNEVNSNNVNQYEVNQCAVKLLENELEKNLKCSRLKTCRKKGRTEENGTDLDDRNMENQAKKINFAFSEPEEKLLDRKGNCLEILTEFEKALSNEKVTKKKEKTQKKKLTDTNKSIMCPTSDDKSQLQDNRVLLFKKRSVNNQSNVCSESVQPFHKSKTAQKIYNKHQRLRHGDDDCLPDFSKAYMNLENLPPLSVSAMSPPTIGVSVISDIAHLSTEVDNVPMKGIKTKLAALQRVPCEGNTSSSPKHTLKDLKKDLEAFGNTSTGMIKLKDLMRSCTFGSAFSQSWNKKKTEGSMNNSQPVLPAFLDSFSSFKPISPNLNQTFTDFSGFKKVTEDGVMNIFDSMDTVFERSSDKIRATGNELSNTGTDFEETINNSRNNFAEPFKNTFNTENNIGSHAITSVFERFEVTSSPVHLLCSTNADMPDYTATKLPLTLTDFSSTPASKALKWNTEPAVRTNLNISHISMCSSNIEESDFEPIPKRPRIKRLQIFESPTEESGINDGVIQSNYTGMSSMMILSAECSQMDITDVTDPNINESNVIGLSLLGSRDSSVYDTHTQHKIFDTNARDGVYNALCSHDVHNTNTRDNNCTTNARAGICSIHSTDEYITSENVSVKCLPETAEVLDKKLSTKAPPLSKCLTSRRDSVKTVGNSTILDYECDPSVDELDTCDDRLLEHSSNSCAASRTFEQKLQADFEEFEDEVIEQQNDIQHFDAACGQEEEKSFLIYDSINTVLCANNTDLAVRSNEVITHCYQGNEERKTSSVFGVHVNGEIQLSSEMPGQKFETVITENCCRLNKALSDSCNETGSAQTKEENIDNLELDQHIPTLNKTRDRTLHNGHQNIQKLERCFRRYSKNEKSESETVVYYSDSDNDKAIVTDSDKDPIEDDDRTDSENMRRREEDDYTKVSEDDNDEDKGSEFVNDREVEAIIVERKKGDDVFDIHDSDEMLDDVLEIFASDEEASFLDEPNEEELSTLVHDINVALGENCEVQAMDLYSLCSPAGTAIELSVPLCSRPVLPEQAALQQPHNEKLPVFQAMNSNPFRNRWMPIGWCFNFFSGSGCGGACSFKHAAPTKTDLRQFLQKIGENCEKGQLDRAMNMLESHTYFQQNTAPATLDVLYSYGCHALKMEYCHKLLLLVASRDLVKQGHIDDIVFLWRKCGCTNIGPLKDAFLIAQDKNLQLQQEPIYILLKAFTDARNLFLLWELMIYCAKNEFDVPMQYIDIALSAAVASPDASLMSNAIAWLEEYDLMQLLNIANVELLQRLIYRLRLMGNLQMADLVQDLLGNCQATNRVGKRSLTPPIQVQVQLSPGSLEAITTGPRAITPPIQSLAHLRPGSRGAIPATQRTGTPPMQGQIQLRPERAGVNLTGYGAVIPPTQGPVHWRPGSRGAIPARQRTRTPPIQGPEHFIPGSRSAIVARRLNGTPPIQDPLQFRPLIQAANGLRQRVITPPALGHSQARSMPMISRTVDQRDECVINGYDTQSGDYWKMFEQIESVSYASNLEGLAELLIRCCTAGYIDQSLLQQFFNILTKDVNHIGSIWRDFILHVDTIFKHEQMENPSLELDMDGISYIGSEIFFMCYDRRLWTQVGEVLEVIQNTEFLMLSPVVEQQRGISLVLMTVDFCVHMRLSEQAATILLAYCSMDLNREMKTQLGTYFSPLTLQLSEQGNHQMAHQILHIAFTWKYRGMHEIASDLILSCLKSKYTDIAVQVYEHYLSNNIEFTIGDDVKRSLLNAFTETNLTDYSNNLYNELKHATSDSHWGTSLFQPQSYGAPRCIVIQPLHTPYEVQLIVKDYLNVLYSFLCDQTTKHRPLPPHELRLSVMLNSHTRDRNNTDLPYLGLGNVSLIVIQTVLEEHFGLLTDLQCQRLSIQPLSLENYLRR